MNSFSITYIIVLSFNSMSKVKNHVGGLKMDQNLCKQLKLYSDSISSIKNDSFYFSHGNNDLCIVCTNNIILDQQFCNFTSAG